MDRRSLSFGQFMSFKDVSKTPFLIVISTNPQHLDNRIWKGHKVCLN